MLSAKEKFMSSDNFGAEHEKQDEEGKKRRKLFRQRKTRLTATLQSRNKHQHFFCVFLSAAGLSIIKNVEQFGK